MIDPKQISKGQNFWYVDFIDGDEHDVSNGKWDDIIWPLDFCEQLNRRGFAFDNYGEAILAARIMLKALEKHCGTPKRDYALYKGEAILAVGTITEIAEQLGVPEKRVAFYLTKSYQKRLEGRKRTKSARYMVDITEED